MQSHPVVSAASRFLATLMVALLPVLLAGPVHAEEAPVERGSIYDIKLQPMAGDKQTTDTLAPFKGKVLLIVNVASKCGLTKQYAELEGLHRKYKDSGLVVLGFPCNDFGGQEPGSETEIVQFCQTEYDVTFPLYAKLHTIGAEQSALYKWLSGPGSPFPGDVTWNFGKFLVSRDGQLVARFEPKTTPDAPEVAEAIQNELSRKP